MTKLRVDRDWKDVCSPSRPSPPINFSPDAATDGRLRLLHRAGGHCGRQDPRLPFDSDIELIHTAAQWPFCFQVVVVSARLAMC